MIFSQRMPEVGTVRYFGLRLRPGVNQPHGRPRSRVVMVMDRFNRWCGDVRGDMANVSRPVQFWELDTTRLLRAVAAFAPQVHVRQLAE